FRGQFQGWPVCPTALRLNDEQRGEALDRLARFEHWIRGTPGLESRLEPNSFFAVAQHYGFPTNYVDLTTNPAIAGFFAGGNPNNMRAAHDSCIVSPRSIDSNSNGCRRTRGAGCCLGKLPCLSRSHGHRLRPPREVAEDLRRTAADWAGCLVRVKAAQ